MVLATLDDVPASRSSELALWREATVIGVRGIDQWGLSIPALRRGVGATIVSASSHTFRQVGPEEYDDFMRNVLDRFPEGEAPRLTPDDLELAWFAQGENRKTAESAGASWHQREPTRHDVRSAVAAGAYPVLLVDLERLGGSYSVLHWVVAVAADDERVTLHDPDDEGPGVREIDWDHLMHAMDVAVWGSAPAMVVLGDWTPDDADGR